MRFDQVAAFPQYLNATYCYNLSANKFCNSNQKLTIPIQNFFFVQADIIFIPFAMSSFVRQLISAFSTRCRFGEVMQLDAFLKKKLLLWILISSTG